ncbi:hypothetical protein LCR_00070 [Aeromonas enteropelogenes]|uniref:Uncharacterized protein n=1 Tax=Aeromonas enteropelogenes TaxID=29489 RepID=A0A175VEX1_AEREN|nr:hypothetical protein LCR_00070 [Aeromonas enteropelogenes]
MAQYLSVQTMPALEPALSSLAVNLVVLCTCFGQKWATGLALGGKGLINGVSAYILGSPSKLLDGRGCREFRGIAG